MYFPALIVSHTHQLSFVGKVNNSSMILGNNKKSNFENLFYSKIKKTYTYLTLKKKSVKKTSEKINRK